MDTGSADTNKILTIPNLMSFFRILLAAVFAVIYWTVNSRAGYFCALGVLVLSGLTDFADGKVARHFHMVSNLGKLLDPISDKVTQIVVVFCLCRDYPVLWILLAVLVVKEAVQGICGLQAVRAVGHNVGAKWFGKVSTFYLYGLLVVLLLLPLLPDFPGWCSAALIVIGIILLLISFVGNVRMFRGILLSAQDAA